MNFKEGLHLIPEHMREGIAAWIEYGVAGDFLTALVSNDLMGAMARADHENAQAIREWTIFLHNYAPSSCYGSPEKVRLWALGHLEARRLAREAGVSP